MALKFPYTDASRPPVQLRTFRTKCEVTVSGFYGGGSPAHPYAAFTLPAGLRCKVFHTGQGRQGFYLDEFPRDLFPPSSFIRHDAVHYGVAIPAEAVEETTPPPPDWPSSKTTNPEAVVNALAQAVQETVVPYAMRRTNGVYVHLDLKPGTLGFRVSRRAGEALEAKDEILYDGFNVDDAIRAWEEA